MTDAVVEPGSTPAQADPTPVAVVDPGATPAVAATPPAGDVEYTFEMPEGVEVDAARKDAFVAVAKDLKLSPEAAQKLVAMETSRIQAEAEAHNAMVKGWADTVAADKELGAPENQAIAKSVIDKFGTPKLIELLNTSGLGNHPELVGLAYRFGKAISEDGFVKSGQAPGAAKSAAQIMFPTMN